MRRPISEGFARCLYDNRNSSSFFMYGFPGCYKVQLAMYTDRSLALIANNLALQERKFHHFRPLLPYVNLANVRIGISFPRSLISFEISTFVKNDATYFNQA